MSEKNDSLSELHRAAKRVLCHTALDPVERVRRQRVFDSMSGLIEGNYAGLRVAANVENETHRHISADGVQSISFYYKGKLAGFRLIDDAAGADQLMQDITGAFRAARDRMAKVR